LVYSGPIFDDAEASGLTMKTITQKLPLIILLALIMTGCRKNHVISERQMILFQLDHVNYTISYQHNGFFIDNDGNVLTYDNPEKWNYPDRELRISAGQIAENLALCTHSGIKIPKEDLLKYSGHIKNIVATKVTAMKNASDNAGSTEYICYQFSDNTQMYKGAILRTEGNFTCENLNFFSKRVAGWMKTISSRIPPK
jgi:hypothetical protein